MDNFMNAASGHIVFAGGGTAGHLFPGLAVAEELLRIAPRLRITFVGTGKPFEASCVRQAGFAYVSLPCRPFPRKAREAFRFLADNFSGYYAARRFLRDENVSLVVGLGSYASVPTARAAVARRTPVVLLEQNVVPGRATRWLAPAAALICSAFENIRPHLRAGCRVRVTGNPLRREFVEAFGRPGYLRDAPADKRRLLVLGGSGGSQTLNEQVPLALYKSRAAIGDWKIVHQTGERDVARVSHLYCKLGMDSLVIPFIDRLPGLLQTSDLAISRAGGTTLAELAASRVPAILLPYPRATDDHQRKNADVFTAAGGSRTLDVRELDGRLDNHLATAIVELTTAHAARLKMAQAIARLARPQATRRVAASIAAMVAAEPLAAV